MIPCHPALRRLCQNEEKSKKAVPILLPAPHPESPADGPIISGWFLDRNRTKNPGWVYAYEVSLFFLWRNQGWKRGSCWICRQYWEFHRPSLAFYCFLRRGRGELGQCRKLYQSPEVLPQYTLSGEPPTQSKTGCSLWINYIRQLSKERIQSWKNSSVWLLLC